MQKKFIILLLMAVMIIELIDGFQVNQVIDSRSGDNEAWEAHKSKYGLEYSGEEDEARKKNYLKADQFISQHNADPSKTSTMAHNLISHLHTHEVEAMNGHIFPPEKEMLPISEDTVEDRSYPLDLDWRNYTGINYMSPIKNQGGCGSCWAFSGTASLESRWAIVNGGPVPNLSEQNLVDCCYTGSTHGNLCNGGGPGDVWNYAASSETFMVGKFPGAGLPINPYYQPKPVVGITSTSDYPYTGVGGQKCKFNKDKVGAWTWYWNIPQRFITEYNLDFTRYSNQNILPRSTPSPIIAELQNGPVSTVTTGSARGFQHYSDGILQESDCPSDGSQNHAVNIIGYGEESGLKYWIIRNSWGESWGQGGYGKFERSDGNGRGTCGVVYAPSWPNVIKAVDPTSPPANEETANNPNSNSNYMIKKFA